MVAITASRIVRLGPTNTNFKTLNPKKSCSQFLGKPLLIKPQFSSLSNFNCHRKCMVLAAGFELFDPIRDLFLGVGVGLPCTVMECGDIIYRSTLPRSDELTLTVPGVILASGTISYLWATPGVAPGFWDMFVLAFTKRVLRPTFKKDDFVLGKKLGEGAFGVVYKVSLGNKKKSIKEGDLVLKKATEYGAVEIWMNERVRRACVYGFMESSSKRGNEYWLIWRYEGESTLADLMMSKEFPYNVGTFFH